MDFWLPLAGPLSVALVLFFVPGAALLVAAGYRGVTAILPAPALSVAVIGASAVLFGAIGIRWNVWLPIAVTLLTCALIFLGRWHLWRRARRVGRHLSDSPDMAGSTDTRVGRWGGRLAIANYAGLGVAALLWLRHGRNILEGQPGAISQTIDNVFHLSAVQYIADTGNASTLSLGALMAGPNGSTLYPAGWHDLVSLVVDVTGTSIPIASNAVMISTMLAWTAACLFLLHCLLPTTPALVAGTAVLSASFPSFPILMTEVGVLLPNLLGLAIAPVGIAFGIQFLGAPSEARRLGPLSAFVLLVVSTVGIGLAHPNAVLFILLVAIPPVVVTLFRTVRAGRSGRLPRRATRLQAAGLVAILLVIPVIWYLLRPGSITWDPVVTVTHAVGLAVTQSAPHYGPAWFVSALVLLGAYWTFRSRRFVWVTAAWGILVYTWVLTAGGPVSGWRTFLTGVFYSNAPRPAAALTLMAIPLAAFGLIWIGQKVTALASHDTARRAAAALRSSTIGARAVRLSDRRGLTPAARVVALPLVVAIAVVGFTQRVPYMDYAVDRASSKYELDSESSLLTADEYRLLRQLPELVPQDTVIATDPWNGSSLAYPLAGITTTTNHPLGHVGPQDQVLAERLDTALIDPEVCEAVESTGAEYVLDFGRQDVEGFNVHYEGFDYLNYASGFEQIAREGDAALYRIAACD